MAGMKALTILPALLLCGITFAETQSPQLQFEQVTIANKKIHESSGLAHSLRYKGLLWTHNDSGSKAVVYGVGLDGKDHGAVKIKGATSVDWEDMCSFYKNKTPYLLIADVGDNKERRKNLTLHILEEPKPGTKSVEVQQTIRFTYEDGPHNCESIAVDRSTNTAYLVTKKKENECGIYALHIPHSPTTKTLKAKRIGTIPAFLATGMDISPDGKKAVIVTYLLALEYTRKANETWAQAFAKKPTILQVPPRSQGEAICYGLDSSTLYLTSEKLPAPLFKLVPNR